MNEVDLGGHYLCELFVRKLLEDKHQPTKIYLEKFQQKEILENPKYI